MKTLSLLLPTLQSMIFSRARAPRRAALPMSDDLAVCPSCAQGLPALHRVFDHRHMLNGKPMCMTCIGRCAVSESRATHRAALPVSDDLAVCPSCAQGLPALHRVFDHRHMLNGKPMCMTCIGRCAVSESRARALVVDGVPVVYGAPFEDDCDRLARITSEGAIHE